MTIGIIISVLVIAIGLVLFLKSKKEDKSSPKEEVGKKEEIGKREEVVKKEETTRRTPTPPRERPPVAKPVETPKELPKCDYAKYDHSRMISTLGLSEDDAVEFIADLISQIESTIPQIRSAIDTKDYEAMESLTHSIKGSATNLGTDGVASLLIDFNTYLKTKKDLDIINSYFKHLVRYTDELKEQYA